MILVALIPAVTAFLCSTLNAGTDADRLDDIIKGGRVNPAWNATNPTQRISPAQSEFYIYVEGLELIGPELSVAEFHSDDELAKDGHKWLAMNVTEDDEEAGLFEKIKVYKIEQDCLQDEGGVSIVSNLTFEASTCDPLTIAWVKSCGEPSTPRRGLNVGFSPKSAELVSDGVVTPMFDGNTKDDIFIVPNDDDSTQIYIYITDPLIKAFVKAPYIITDHELVSPTIEGTGAVSSWVNSEPQGITITYNCHVNNGSRGEISLILEVPYFHDLELRFYKQCGSKKKAAAAFSWFKTFLFLSLFGFVGIAFWSFYKWYVEGTNFWDAVPFGRHLEQMYLWTKETVFGKGAYPNMRDERDLPDEDDGKIGFNVHTNYGSI
mmetsp:Transcript_23784/g.42088  ORF Transcript_23784/g.42088 Transcript_23784/m.42088 type:complete len:377 (+) Transcript_23784:1233-2363(+)|eukprot:CAMPEP_0204904848 /NCGR_PEP_ID=MMETSP1397-20131031/5074_1 /ASSEMBLY_ACC=CAM_ASM_000891 /TAXON_ID=49980 /ORGANISM="Climacostomum Climacostomum virens, Strain Stock W-24" /LENGTH=376 /DNA_ID=CAMNT_0052073671 /DNA_START=1219 /DNA_END=2349 /DNA_ORIENTATION=+